MHGMEGRHNTRSLQTAAAYGGFMMNNVLSPPMHGPLVRWLAPQRGANARHEGGDRLTLSPKAKFGIEICVRCVRLHALSFAREVPAQYANTKPTAADGKLQPVHTHAHPLRGVPVPWLGVVGGQWYI